MSFYTVFRKKTHLHFLLYPSVWCSIAVYTALKPLFSNVMITYNRPQRIFSFYTIGILHLSDISFLKSTHQSKRRRSTFKWAFLPARRYASAGNSDRNVSVCLSAHPSATRRYCVKTKKASVVISSPSGNPKALVFWRQISSPNSKGFPPNGGLKELWGKKVQRFSSFTHQYLENGSRYGQSYY